MYFDILPVGYDFMSRSKCPGTWSPEIGVYERTTSFWTVMLGSFWSVTGRVAAMEMCWPIGRPRIEVGVGRAKR
jgi:hypothetical protein